MWWFDIHVKHRVITKVKIITHLLPHIVKIVNFCVCIVRMLKIINSQVYIAILLTIVTMLYIRFLELIHLITESLNRLTNIPFPAPRIPCQWPFYSLFLWVWLLFLDSTYKWYEAEFVFLCLACFTWYNALQVHPCSHDTLFIHLCQWTFRLFPYLRYCG